MAGEPNAAANEGPLCQEFSWNLVDAVEIESTTCRLRAG